MAKKKTENEYPEVRFHVAGIDIGSEEHWVAIPQESSDNPVRSFAAHTNGLLALVAFLLEHCIQVAVMEATGIYHEALFNLLEDNGIKPVLLNPRSLAGIPKKSDVKDCQWLQKAYSHGFGNACFVPDKMIIGLRQLCRARDDLNHAVRDLVNKMIKTLRQMSINLEKAVSDIQGETGMRIISAIVEDGIRDPCRLASLRDPRCKLSRYEIAPHLKGVYTDFHLTNLAMYYRIYKNYITEMRALEDKILEYLRGMPSSSRTEESEEPAEPNKAKKKASRMSRTEGDRMFGNMIRAEAHRILGVDLSLVEGIGPQVILVFLSELGTDLSAFESAGRLASYLGLSPGCSISGGKVLRKGTKKVAHRLAMALRMAAMSLWRSKSWLGGFFRKMRARQGTPKAVTTTAHKLLKLAYGLVKNGSEYITRTAEEEEEKQKAYQMRILLSKAVELGVQVVNPDGSAVMSL